MKPLDSLNEHETLNNKWLGYDPASDDYFFEIWTVRLFLAIDYPHCFLVSVLCFETTDVVNFKSSSVPTEALYRIRYRFSNMRSNNLEEILTQGSFRSQVPGVMKTV